MHMTVLVRRTENDRVDCTLGKCAGNVTTHRLVVPRPMPSKLSWTVSMRDADGGRVRAVGRTTATVKALFEIRQGAGEAVHFGPVVPNASRWPWIRTVSERGWFDCGSLSAAAGAHPCSIAATAGATLVAR
jgi:hypothetical protein